MRSYYSTKTCVATSIKTTCMAFLLYRKYFNSTEKMLKFLCQLSNTMTKVQTSNFPFIHVSFQYNYFDYLTKK